MATPNQLSFLPDDYLERKAQRRANAICGLLFLMVMGGLGSAFTLSEQATRRVDQQHAQVEQQYLAEAKRIELVKEMQEKQKRMVHQAELTASLLERVPRSYILAEITNGLPAGVSLLDLSMDSKARPKAAAEVTKTAYEQKKAARQAAVEKSSSSASSAPAEPKVLDVSLKLTGMARTDVQVAQFLHRLSQSSLLKDVNLAVTEEGKFEDEKIRRFQIEMMLSPTAEVKRGARAEQTTSVELKPEQ